MFQLVWFPLNECVCVLVQLAAVFITVFPKDLISLGFLLFLTVAFKIIIVPVSLWPSSSSLSPSFLRSGPVGPQRGSEHFQAAQTNQQQSAAVRTRHHQLPDIHLRWPGAGAQRPCQCATLRWHVPQLASQRLWHVRALDQYDSGTIQKATTMQLSFNFCINMLYILYFQWPEWKDPCPVHEDRLTISLQRTPGGEIQM